jgi:hypothetical protein
VISRALNSDSSLGVRITVALFNDAVSLVKIMWLKDNYVR